MEGMETSNVKQLTCQAPFARMKRFPLPSILTWIGSDKSTLVFFWPLMLSYIFRWCFFFQDSCCFQQFFTWGCKLMSILVKTTWLKTPPMGAMFPSNVLRSKLHQNRLLEAAVEPENGPLERRSFLKTIIFKFYVKLWGCNTCCIYHYTCGM